MYLHLDFISKELWLDDHPQKKNYGWMRTCCFSSFLVLLYAWIDEKNLNHNLVENLMF